MPAITLMFDRMRRMNRMLRINALGFGLWAAPALLAQGAVQWPAYGSDLGATKYSTAADINRSNVSRLAVAWEWATGETANTEFRARPGSFEGTPLMINDTLYIST